MLAISHLHRDKSLLRAVISQSKKSKAWQNTLVLINSGITYTNYPPTFDELGRCFIVASSPNPTRLAHWEKYHEDVIQYVMAPPSIEEVVELVYVTLFQLANATLARVYTIK